MSLLFLDLNERMINIAQRVFDTQFLQDKKLGTEYDERRKRLMLWDIQYNLRLLGIATKYNAEMIFSDYAVWIYRLLVSRMKELSRERIKEHMIDHYKILRAVLADEVLEDGKALLHLDNAIKLTMDLQDEEIDLSFETGKHALLRKEFLDCLLRSDRQGASNLIDGAARSGVPLQELYVDIFQKTMIEIGNMWHQGKIGVDREHYCTAMTQSIMTQLYPIIFRTPRKNKKILACSVGTELHEMGIRLICDIFELYGWDSIYLGHAVPGEGIINSIKENRPDLVALSVTMPVHLEACEEIVKTINSRNDLKDVAIAIGGRAIQLAPHLAEEWGLAVTAKDGLELVAWANETII